MSTSVIARLYYGPTHRMMFRAGTYLALLRSLTQAHLVSEFYRGSDLTLHTLQRLQRTRDALRVLVLHGCQSPAGLQTLARLRAIHAPLTASSDDFLYVLGLFIVEPVRWQADLGASPLSPQDEQALLSFWAQVGEGMGLDGTHRSMTQWQQFCRQHEQRHSQWTPEGQALARTCLEDVVRLSVPWWGRSAFRALMRATAEPAMWRLLGLTPSLPWTRPAWRWLARMA